MSFSSPFDCRQGSRTTCWSQALSWHCLTSFCYWWIRYSPPSSSQDQLVTLKWQIRIFKNQKPLILACLGCPLRFKSGRRDWLHESWPMHYSFPTSRPPQKLRWKDARTAAGWPMRPSHVTSTVTHESRLWESNGTKKRIQSVCPLPSSLSVVLTSSLAGAQLAL